MQTAQMVSLLVVTIVLILTACAPPPRTPNTVTVSAPAITVVATMTVTGTPLSSTPPTAQAPTASPATLSTATAAANWTLSGRLYLLTSQGISSSACNDLKSSGFITGLLGGSMSYVYQRLPTYWGEIQPANTIILFNATAEQLSILSDWPSQYVELFPFSVQELSAVNSLPFAYLKRQSGGPIRAIIVANNEADTSLLLAAIKNSQVPVGMPWRLVNGQVVACETSSGWYKPPKEISDANFRVIYPEGYETDASNMLAWANETVTKLQTPFPDFTSVIGSRATIQIMSSGDPSHSSADPTAISITFVAPSVAAWSSSYYDRDWYVGNIAHELGHVYLDKLRNQAGGYQTSNCPNWFSEGFGEYLRIFAIGQQTFDTKYSRYSSEIPNIVANGTSGISDIYAGGAWALRFMDAKFGIDKIKGIISSKQTTFGGAVTEQTGLTAIQFDDQLKEWVKTQ